MYKDAHMYASRPLIFSSFHSKFFWIVCLAFSTPSSHICNASSLNVLSHIFFTILFTLISFLFFLFCCDSKHAQRKRKQQTNKILYQRNISLFGTKKKPTRKAKMRTLTNILFGILHFNTFKRASQQDNKGSQMSKSKHSKERRMKSRERRLWAKHD